jgi:hypothetical protein
MACAFGSSTTTTVRLHEMPRTEKFIEPKMTRCAFAGGITLDVVE